MTEAKSVRILHFVPEPLPTHRADVAVLFGKYLPRHQVQCHIVGKQGQGEMPAHGFASVQTASNAGSRWKQEWAYLRLAWRNLWAAKPSNYDLIQVRDAVGIGLLAMLIARIKGIPFVYWMSFLMNEGRIGRARAEIAKGGGWRYRLVLAKGLLEAFLLDHLVLRGARHVFVQSEAMQKVILARGIPAAKITPVPMGVDSETLAAREVIPQRLPGWEQLPLIAYLGTLDRSREFETLLDALLIVRRTWPQAKLLLIGDSATPNDLVLLRAYADKLGLADAMHITGWMQAKQAWPLLAAADVAVSYFPRSVLFDVCTPTKLLEYLALAMPCVGNDSPDQVQVLSASQAGWLTASTAQDMAQAIVQVLDDPGYARQRASSGPAYIEANRSYRVISASLAASYQRLLADQEKA